MIHSHDDATRTVTTYDESGVVASTRPYTAEENAAAGAAIRTRTAAHVVSQYD